MTAARTTTAYDVIVIGAGHAGCEAALAAARAGCRVLVLTPNLDRVGFMPCNPSIGGPGKSHIVAEVDALGGEMARAADRAALQVRALNTSKGPAVQATRIQADKSLYALTMKEALETQPGLAVVQDDAVGLNVVDTGDGRRSVKAVVTRLMGAVPARAVVVTAGTFLRAAMISGEGRVSGGRAGDRADEDLAHAIAAGGFKLRRLKTGTPPRIDARTVDLAGCEPQPGDQTALWLSRDGRRGHIDPMTLSPLAIHVPYLTVGWRDQLSCFRLATNPAAHQLIINNLDRAPMFNGGIEGIGPRYCPSIEDKVARFGEKDAHPIFLEPEGWRTTELYVQGLSTSLPPDVQDAVIRTIPQLRAARITRYGYAVEYDALDPAELQHTLESRRIAGLYFAGQVNGTSGYEEAAGQGILAGINAAALVQEREQLTLGREQSYIGVMIDDLVTKPFDEPYRMLTSRAEFRLTLRPGTADRRLAEIAAARGLITDQRANDVDREQRRVDEAARWLERTRVRLPVTSDSAEGKVVTLGELLRRPGVGIAQVAAIAEHAGFNANAALPTMLWTDVEEQVKYAAFVEREGREVDRRAALEHRALPAAIDYAGIPGLRIEASQKLATHRPRTIGEASRLAGVTPSDVAALLIHTAQHAPEAARV